MNDLQLIRNDIQAPAVIPEVETIHKELDGLRAMILSQNALLEQLVQAQAKARVNRIQEFALHQALRDRAAELRDREGLPKEAGRKISGAILKTVRQLTGCRALGDVPAVKFDQCMAAIQGWDMPGALRKIRRGLNDER